MDGFKYIEEVSTLAMDPEKCVGCTLCTQVCPHTVFEMENKRSVIVDVNACMECGACVNNCPTEAIRVSPGVG